MSLMHIAFIDDEPDNLSAWHDAMSILCGPNVELRCFESIATFEKAVTLGYVPSVLFIDFFLNGHYGIEAIEMARQYFGDDVILIAHSSMEEANRRMIKAGADLMLSKVKGASPSPTITSRFADFRAFMRFMGVEP